MEFRLVQVERPLRDVGTVEAVARIDRLIVAQHRIAAEDRAAHLLAVEQVFHRHDEVGIARRVCIQPHDKVGVVAGLGLEELETRGRL